jgi:biofilm PGA synthesis protein PgaA
VDPVHRHDATDRAIAVLERRIAELETDPEQSVEILNRARFDLLAAYRERTRMSDAVALYERLRREGVTVPDYARLSAASAYLYLEHPETARDIYQSVLDENPRNAEVRFEARLGLFYVWVDLERFDKAYETIDALDREQPRFRRFIDTGANVENDAKVVTVVAAALARSWAGQLADAWDRLSRLAAGAPGSSGIQTERAGVARARGWPRRSIDIVEPWRQERPTDLDVRLGYAASLLALRRYPEAGAEIKSLYGVYPENKGVQDLKREWDIHAMWEWVTEVKPTYGSEPTAQNPGFDVASRLWSPPLGDYWRVTVGYRLVTENLEEGRETFHRTAAGLEYRGPDLRAFGEVTYNVSTEDRVGGRAEIEWAPTDQLTLSAMGEIFSQDTPLKALKNGVTANAVEAGIGYRFHESSELAFTWRRMDFSDDNVRNEFIPHFAQRVLDKPRLTVTAIVEPYYSTNSRTDVPYFSPEWVFSPTVALAVEHTAWRRYRWSLVQALTATAGGTWQSGFDPEPNGSLAYEHRWQFGPRCELSYGVSIGSAVYDGDRQLQFAGFTRLSVRF